MYLFDVITLTGDLPGFKTYVEFKNAWYYEWNDQVPWVDEKLWLEHGVWEEPAIEINHACQPFRFKDGRVEWPSCNWETENRCNGGNLPGIYDIGYLTYCESYEWYEELEDGDLKNKALMEKALLEAPQEHENDKGADFCLWLERCFGNYHKLDCELMMKLEDYWWNIRGVETSHNDIWSNYWHQNDEAWLKAECKLRNEKPQWLKRGKLINKEDNEWKDDLFNELDMKGSRNIDELQHEVQFREVLRSLIMKYCKGWDNKKNVQRKMLNRIKEKINEGYESCSSDDTWYKEKFEEEEKL